MKNLIKKIADAKKEIGKISKDSTNPFYKSKYFDINALLEHVEHVLEKQGLMILQPIEEMKVVTKIYDTETGESLESGIMLPEINDPQKLGSAITYFRRYTLQSLLSLQAEDDDANRTVSGIKKQVSKNPELWLNSYTDKFKKEYTDIFIKAYKSVQNNEITVEKIRKKYKVGKETAKLLETPNLM